MADIITNLVGVAVSLLSTNYSHTVTRELPCHLCDTPHAYELIAVHNVWRRRSVPVLGEDGKVTPFEVGKPVVIHVLSSTNLAQLQHPHGMPVPVEASRGIALGFDTNNVISTLERFNPSAPGTLPLPTNTFVPRSVMQRSYVVPPANQKFYVVPPAVEIYAVPLPATLDGFNPSIP